MAPWYKRPTVPDPVSWHGVALASLSEALRCFAGENGTMGFVHLPKKTAQIHRLKKMGYMIENAKDARQKGKSGVPSKGYRWFASALHPSS